MDKHRRKAKGKSVYRPEYRVDGQLLTKEKQQEGKQLRHSRRRKVENGVLILSWGDKWLILCAKAVIFASLIAGR